MDINITTRNFDADESIKEYIHAKLDKLENVYRRIYKCEVILSEEKLRKNVEIILYLKRNRVVASDDSPDLFASVDNAYDKIRKQLRRLAGRLSSKRRRDVFSNILKPVVRFGRGNAIKNIETGKLVKSEMFADKPMLPDEAKLELELMDKAFIMFKNADTGEANVIYKKSDGNYGLIEPGF